MSAEEPDAGESAVRGHASSVWVELGRRSYEVHVGPGASVPALASAAAAARRRRVALLADERVLALHGGPVLDRLAADGVEAESFPLRQGEFSKTLAEAERTASAVVRWGCERGDVVVALGGGAATDAAGFVAAVLLRGLAWVPLPTSLLGQVDAAVGGKTAVNLPEGKNLVGAFHQPLAVGCDTSLLSTLDDRELRAGFAEVVKTAWIGDPTLFKELETDPPRDSGHPRLAEIVRRCVAVKASIVAEDERESGRREVLNFGHTIGHAIETLGAGRYLHGEAVSLGLVAAVRLSVETGQCDSSLLERLVTVLGSLGLPVAAPELDVDAVLAQTRRDKKRSAGADRYQLTRGLGHVSVSPGLPEQAPRAAIEYLKR